MLPVDTPENSLEMVAAVWVPTVTLVFPVLVSTRREDMRFIMKGQGRFLNQFVFLFRAARLLLIDLPISERNVLAP